MDGKDLLKCGIATGAAYLAGVMFYDPKSYGVKIEKNSDEPKKIAITVATTFGLACFINKAVKEHSIECQGDIVALAGRLTVLGTLLTLPNNLWANNNMKLYFKDRGFNFVSLVAMMEVFKYVNI